MQRRPVVRALTTLWAVWFVLLLSEPALLHPCPMHDGVPIAAAPNAALPGQPGPVEASGMPDIASAAPSHHAHMMGGGESADPTPAAPHQGHSCSCLGDCALSIAVVPASAHRLATASALHQSAPLFDDAARVVKVAADHVIPFANGPPDRLRA